MHAKKLVVSPYLQYVLIGALLGAIPAVLIPLLTDACGQALLAAQQIGGNVPTPRVMGGSTGVHSLWAPFATMTATALYGLVFAVPVVAVFRCLRGTPPFERWHETPPVAALGTANEFPAGRTATPSPKIREEAP